MLAVELPGDETSVVAPVEQAVAAAFGDTVEPVGQIAERVGVQRLPI